MMVMKKTFIMARLPVSQAVVNHLGGRMCSGVHQWHDDNEMKNETEILALIQ